MIFQFFFIEKAFAIFLLRKEKDLMLFIYKKKKKNWRLLFKNHFDILEIILAILFKNNFDNFY